jgi:hypothetical protein
LRDVAQEWFGNLAITVVLGVASRIIQQRRSSLEHFDKVPRLLLSEMKAWCFWHCVFSVLANACAQLRMRIEHLSVESKRAMHVARRLTVELSGARADV